LLNSGGFYLGATLVSTEMARLMVHVEGVVSSLISTAIAITGNVNNRRRTLRVAANDVRFAAKKAA